GDEAAMAELFGQYRERLRRMIALRMDRRMQGRVDASDVLQDAYVDLAQQLPDYAKDPKLPVFLWMRRLIGQRLSKLHRDHLGAAKRNAALEVSLNRGPMPQASSFVLASQLMGQFTSAGQKAIRAEMQLKLQEVLNGLDLNDREIIALRHFEQLDNREIAILLEISEAAAIQRHYRAMLRLRDALKGIPGMLG
ncbi:MAG: sigma-70 family RNA polymerase sigma factor, partial [Gammaproteobacteria bacterium]|nr:sigma-70 family RNA polymerase sigma factor [Gammaproteobacteria bacterium]